MKCENPSLLIDLILKECILLHLRKEQMSSYLYSKLIYPCGKVKAKLLRHSRVISRNYRSHYKK